LEPHGQFGTKMHGGSDSASERYIFTQLNSITRYIFPDADDSILKYMDDDGVSIEPEFYSPIIPFVLMNGITGIGTGFSTSIPSYNPIDIITYLKQKIETPNTTVLFDPNPYYEGFTGTIEKIADTKYLIKGRYEKIAEDKIRIVELPIGTWTMPYISFLEELVDGSVDKNGKKIPPVLKDFISHCTEVSVDITITFPSKTKLRELESHTDSHHINGIEKLLKLTTTVSTTNMKPFKN
jgi:DNA topoisomerase-2